MSSNFSQLLTRMRLGAWLTDLISKEETGVPVSKVLELHVEDFGEHFPLKQLGSWNPVKALEFMPEFVSVSSNPETGEKQILSPNISVLLIDKKSPY